MVEHPSFPAVNLQGQRRTVRSRFQPQAVAGMRLEDRDKNLLCDLFLHRAMARGQLEALYFSSTVRCNARLRQLFDHEFVRRYYHPLAPYGSQAIYLIGKNAVPVVARQLEMEFAEVKRQARSSRTPTFIEHTLAITDVRLAFQKAARNDPWIEIERWLAEPLCRHEYEIRAEGGAWRKEVFKPDAFLRLLHRETGEYSNYFLEIDLGHTSSKQFFAKIQMHQRYLASGLFNTVFGEGHFETLVITTSKRRIGNLKTLLKGREGIGVNFATFTDIQAAGILGEVWYMPLASEPAVLF